MSSPASPSPASPASSAEILTPSRKVKALLARFDDSDDDLATEGAFPAAKAVTVSRENDADKDTANSSSSSNDEDDVLVSRKSKSRMATRLDDSGSEGSVNTPNALDVANEEQSEPKSEPHRRRLLINRKQRAAAASPQGLPRSPISPLSYPSPSAIPDAQLSSHTGPDSDSDDLPDDPLNVPKEKLHALVEKHRKQRREREAAEAAKKDKREKASSEPLAEESDASADAESDGEKLTRAAKPTRKASKKAREEMARETQRMTRNMQLAHQARTRKKFSKDSFLAKFSTPLASASESPHQQQQQQQQHREQQHQQHQNQSDSHSSPKSSHGSSDIERGSHHTTPPTSPPASPDYGKLDRMVGPPNLSAEGKGKGKAVQESVSKLDKSARLREVLSKSFSDSEDIDLEVITDPGEVLKYAPFEKLPSRAAAETQSHRVLRALAHVHDASKSRGSPMNKAELDLSLKIAARLQAKQEREEKIEKLRARGKDIRTAEEREREQEEIEDLVEKARQEAAELQKREKELAKKDGTYIKDGIDSDDSDDEDFDDVDDDAVSGESEEEEEEEEGEEKSNASEKDLVDDAAEEASDEGEEEHSGEAEEEHADDDMEEDFARPSLHLPSRKPRQARVVDDDDEETESETVPRPDCPTHQAHAKSPAKTPQSIIRSARKPIPGLDMSDDLPMDLSQAFAATMADTQSQSNEPGREDDSYDLAPLAPSPGLGIMPQLNRLDSLDMVSNSQPSQILPLEMDSSLLQTPRIPASPLLTREGSQSQFSPSRVLFEPTQDAGYVYSPFKGNRFDTPQQSLPDSTHDTALRSDNGDASPLLERKGRLRRGRVAAESESEEEANEGADKSKSAFALMKHAAKKAEQQAFDKSKSDARGIVDEAAEESDDEYAGLGGASDDEEGVENEDDQRMIDNDTEVGQGEEAKLAGHFADRERKEDEAAVSKLMKDIATGALRRKRGAQDDLDLSDDEAEAAARRRKAKQRQFARMHRELLKDEAVGKIADDKKKEAFLKSIEDHQLLSDDDLDFDHGDTSAEESQSQSQPPPDMEVADGEQPLNAVSDSRLNHRRSNHRHNKKPSTLAEIRESVSFLIEEPESQAGLIDLGLSDSEDEPEAYVDLDRHLRAAEADENELEDGDGDGLADFIVEDNRPGKQEAAPPLRQPFGERRTRVNVVNRVSLLRQSSSASSSGGGSGGSSSSSSTTKMAFYTSSSSSSSSTTSFKGPTLLRRATTNSALGSFTVTEGVSATGVTVAKTERGSASQEKEFIRKGKGGLRNAVNYRGPATTASASWKGRQTVREERMSARAGVAKREAVKGRKQAGFLGGLFGSGWD